MRNSRFRTGFTLVELLVVIAIIGILVALLLPAIQAAREAARRTECSNKAKQIGLGTHNFHDTYKRFPAACTRNTGGTPAKFAANFLYHILPFIEQQMVYNQTVYNGEPAPMTAQVWDNPLAGTPSGTLRSLVMPPYVCPSDYTMKDGYASNQVNAWGGSSYAANCYLVGILNKGYWGEPQYKMENIPDGTTNTILMAERLAACGNGTGNLWAWPGGDWGPNNWGVTFANQPWGGNWAQVPMISPMPWLTACTPLVPAQVIPRFVP